MTSARRLILIHVISFLLGREKFKQPAEAPAETEEARFRVSFDDFLQRGTKESSF
jgi:hypothetical protein